MPSDTIVVQNSAMPNSSSTNAAFTNGATNPQQNNGKATNTATPQNQNFPPPKTDKPRPHVCGTCSRSFARLEHLKRHERSHTKEKPFECPECTRCFARRDLLLRHQQKLHMSSTPSSRPRAGRRESTSSMSGTGPGRVRKSSVANGSGNAQGASAAATMRPRANTISHVDGATLGMIAAANASVTRNGLMSQGLSHLPGMNSLQGPGGYEFRGMSTALGHHGNFHGLPKLETHGLSNLEIGGGLRTAPPYGGLSSDIDLERFYFPAGSTVNPAQLHFTDSPQGLPMMSPSSPFQHGFPGMSTNQVLMEDEDSFDWISGFDGSAAFSAQNENAMEGSSPSAISSASQSGISEVMLDGSNNPAQTSGSLWPQNPMMPPATVAPSQFSLEMSGTSFGEMNPPPSTLSPNSLHGQNGRADSLFSTPPPMGALSPNSMVPGLPNQFFHPPMVFASETPSTSSASMNGSTRKTSITSVSTDSITDATRQALLVSLSQPPPFTHNHRKYSSPSISSPFSPVFGSKSGNNSVSLPSTADLQRYVGSYIQYFHPHLPFLHLPTLTFSAPEYTDSLRSLTNHSGFSQSSISGGGGCLILAMAAIGALFEYESAVSLELFESAKKLIHLFLEERRKADLSNAINRSNTGNENSIQNTPLWLVQAMLLNVVYGHNCGDKLKSGIANTHCAALVSLARAAGLPTGEMPQGQSFFQKSSPAEDRSRSEDVQMGDDSQSAPDPSNEQNEWYNWKVAEERKRTCYAVFILSSLLVSAYNMAPALTSSEIRLDLPCDEDLWAAESATAWYAKGGATLAQHNAVPFATALSTLLSADQRQSHSHQMAQPYQAFDANVNNGTVPDSDLKPSAFGCLILINALHNYIWETRQRHHSPTWSPADTEATHAHIEPALKAWQAAWASNPHHSVERPNPFGLGPLSADSIPLLDLAYIRLFVNLGRSKECFWQRDFEGMAEELARGSGIAQHTDHSPGSGSSGSSSSNVTDSHNSAMSGTSSPNSPTSSSNLNGVKTPTPNHVVPVLPSNQMRSTGQISKRERHLRKAAFYAADSLSMSDKLGVTFADFNSRELPLQCALCAFECAQVLAEWVATVQERVGRYLGILGRDQIDYEAVPGIMLLESEDCKLLEKVTEVLNSAEVKMSYEMGGMGGIQSLGDWGYGGRILRITACMLDKASVWPVIHIAGQALRVQADHMEGRAKNSVPGKE